LLNLYAGGNSLSTNGAFNPFGGPGAVFQPFSQITRGNTELDPEIGKTLGIGAVLTPSFLPGFSGSVDFYKIKIRGAIASTTFQNTINQCFAGVQLYCNNIHSDVNGTVASAADLAAGNVRAIYTPPLNLNQQSQKGLDVDLTYNLPLATFGSNLPGSLIFRGLLGRVFSSKTADGITGQVVENVGTNSFEPPNRVSTPFWKLFLTQTLRMDPWNVTLTERGVSKGYINPNAVECTSGCPLSTPLNPTISHNRIKGAWLVDVSVDYDLLNRERDGMDVSLGLRVDNLLDKDPVAIPSVNYFLPPANGTLYDLMGRVFHVSLRFRR
jgi:hypothetical protein